MMLSQKTIDAILMLQKIYPDTRSALLPALHLAQAELGYLPGNIQNTIADLFDIDASEVNGVVTFYDMFHEEPTGKHLIHVCKNVSCMLRGCDNLLKGICEKLQIQPGETSSDGEFTVIASECLAACDRAPMILVDDEVIGPVKLDEIDEILSRSKQGKGRASPICLEELSHA